MQLLCLGVGEKRMEYKQLWEKMPTPKSIVHAVETLHFFIIDALSTFLETRL